MGDADVVESRTRRATREGSAAAALPRQAEIRTGADGGADGSEAPAADVHLGGELIRAPAAAAPRKSRRRLSLRTSLTPKNYRRGSNESGEGSVRSSKTTKSHTRRRSLGMSPGADSVAETVDGTSRFTKSHHRTQKKMGMSGLFRRRMVETNGLAAATATTKGGALDLDATSTDAPSGGKSIRDGGGAKKKDKTAIKDLREAGETTTLDGNASRHSPTDEQSSGEAEARRKAEARAKREARKEMENQTPQLVTPESEEAKAKERRKAKREMKRQLSAARALGDETAEAKARRRAERRARREMKNQVSTPRTLDNISESKRPFACEERPKEGGDNGKSQLVADSAETAAQTPAERCEVSPSTLASPQTATSANKCTLPHGTERPRRQREPEPSEEEVVPTAAEVRAFLSVFDLRDIPDVLDEMLEFEASRVVLPGTEDAEEEEEEEEVAATAEEVRIFSSHFPPEELPTVRAEMQEFVVRGRAATVAPGNGRRHALVHAQSRGSRSLNPASPGACRPALVRLRSQGARFLDAAAAEELPSRGLDRQKMKRLTHWESGEVDEHHLSQANVEISNSNANRGTATAGSKLLGISMIVAPTCAKLLRKIEQKPNEVIGIISNISNNAQEAISNVTTEAQELAKSNTTGVQELAKNNQKKEEKGPAAFQTEDHLRDTYRAELARGETYYDNRQYPRAMTCFCDAKSSLLAVVELPERESDKETPSPGPYPRLRDRMNTVSAFGIEQNSVLPVALLPRG